MSFTFVKINPITFGISIPESIQHRIQEGETFKVVYSNNNELTLVADESDISNNHDRDNPGIQPPENLDQINLNVSSNEPDNSSSDGDSDEEDLKDLFTSNMRVEQIDRIFSMGRNEFAQAVSSIYSNRDKMKLLQPYLVSKSIVEMDLQLSPPALAIKLRYIATNGTMVRNGYANTLFLKTKSIPSLRIDGVNSFQEWWDAAENEQKVFLFAKAKGGNLFYSEGPQLIEYNCSQETVRRLETSISKVHSFL
jgi:hypothetical protein